MGGMLVGEWKRLTVAKAKQVLKFALVLGVLMSVTWWIDKYDIQLYNDDAGPYSHTREVAWLMLAFFETTGLIHIILYSLVANRALFTALKLPVILSLTVLTAGVFSARIYGWHIPDSIAQAVWMIYYPLVSMVAVLVRYRFLRKGK